jgi:hypothetical protein
LKYSLGALDRLKGLSSSGPPRGNACGNTDTVERCSCDLKLGLPCNGGFDATHSQEVVHPILRQRLIPALQRSQGGIRTDADKVAEFLHEKFHELVVVEVCGAKIINSATVDPQSDLSGAEQVWPLSVQEGQRCREKSLTRALA